MQYIGQSYGLSCAAPTAVTIDMSSVSFEAVLGARTQAVVIFAAAK
jgi:hypothetical protein